MSEDHDIDLPDRTEPASGLIKSFAELRDASKGAFDQIEDVETYVRGLRGEGRDPDASPDDDLPDTLDIRHGPSADTVKALMRKLEAARVEIDRLKAGQHSPAPDLTGLSKRLRERAARCHRTSNPDSIPSLLCDAANAIDRMTTILRESSWPIVGGTPPPAVGREVLGRIAWNASAETLTRLGASVIPLAWEDADDSMREHMRCIADAIAVAIERLGGAARPAVDREAIERLTEEIMEAVYDDDASTEPSEGFLWIYGRVQQINSDGSFSVKEWRQAASEWVAMRLGQYADAVIAALGQPCPKPAEVAGVDGNLPVEAIVDVRRGDRWSWHAFGRFHDAQMFAAKAEADEDIVRVNIMHGTWTYHPATQLDAKEAGSIDRLLEMCRETMEALVDYQDRVEENGCEEWISPHIVEKLAVAVAAVEAKGVTP